MEYEYKILETVEPTASERQLNEDLGASGWLLVTIIEWNGKWFYYFARPKNSH